MLTRLVGLCLALVLIGALSTMPSAWAGPKVSVDSVKIDMGHVRPGTVAEHKVILKNAGDEALELGELKSSCPCASIVPLSDEQKRIAPGSEIELTIRYDTEERIGKTGATVFVSTNDPEKPVVFFDISIVIDVLVSVNPPGGLFWGYAARGYPLEKTMTFSPGNVTDEIEVVSIRVEHPGVKVETKPIEVNGKKVVEASFFIEPDVELGKLDTIVEARVTGGGEEATVRVPMRGSVLGDILLTPASIVSPKTAYRQGARISEITVRSSRPGETPPPEIVAALTSGSIKAEIAQGIPEDRRVVTVSAADDAAGGPRSGVVYVVTTSKDEPIIAVPVYFRMGYSVVAHPGKVVLSAENDRESGQRIELRATGPMKIEDVAFDSDLVQVDVEVAEQAAEDKPAVLVMRPVATSSGSAGTLVVVKTSLPGGEGLEIPVVIKGAQG